MTDEQWALTCQRDQAWDRARDSYFDTGVFPNGVAGKTTRCISSGAKDKMTDMCWSEVITHYPNQKGHLMKKLLLLVPMVLTGCWVTEKIVENADTLEGVAGTATSMGPQGAIAGLAITTVVGIAKWWEHKASAKEIIKATQKAKAELPEESKKILKAAYLKAMPEKIQKYVGKVKDAIK